MQILLSFTAEEKKRLYLTYKRNATNYSQIKEKVLGVDIEQSYRRKRKGILFFFTAITFIVAVSSAFSIVADHWDSFIAIWAIWGIFFTVLLIALSLMYKNTVRIYGANKLFFEQFEDLAQASPSLEIFVEKQEK